MDDSLDLSLGLGPDRDHVAARADGHDRLADHPRQLGGAQHRVQPFPHPILRGPQPPPNGGQLGRGGVQDLAALIDAADDPCRELGRGIEVFTQTGQVGLRPASESLLEAGGGLQRVGHLEQICRRQPTATRGPVERSADVTRAADRCLCLVVEQPSGLVGLVLEQGDVRGVGTRHRRQRQLACRLEAGQLGQLLDDCPELERAQGALVGRDRRALSGGRCAGHRRSRSASGVRPRVRHNRLRSAVRCGSAGSVREPARW